MKNMQGKLEKIARMSKSCPRCLADKESGEHSQIVCWGYCWRDYQTGLKYTQMDTEKWLEQYATNLI